MTKEYMMNTIAKTRGLEDYYTIKFFELCEKENNLDNLENMFIAILALPFDNEDEE